LKYKIELNCKHNRIPNIEKLFDHAQLHVKVLLSTARNLICANNGLLENIITYLRNLKPKWEKIQSSFILVTGALPTREIESSKMDIREG